MRPKAAAPLLAFYADDLTGASDMMDVLATAGLDATVLLEPVGEDGIQAYADRNVIGVAGMSRSKPPEWMDLHLPGALKRLKETGAPVVQYKVCSTFDSARDVGNLAKVIEIGNRIFGQDRTPVATASPALRRYVVFGNLFASFGADVFRIDRHPVMRRHPVTPMGESDLVQHLLDQGCGRVGLVDFVRLEKDAQGTYGSLPAGLDAVIFDALNDRHVSALGSLLWSMAADRQIFVVGSSGVGDALVAAWRALGSIPASPKLAPLPPTERVAVVSGSLSPTTRRQVAAAAGSGAFVPVPLDIAGFVQGEADFELAMTRGLDVLEQGLSPIFTTWDDTVAVAAPTDTAPVEELGSALGRLLGELMKRTPLSRVVVMGGDTSGAVMRAMDYEAVSFAYPLAPGSPLCRAHPRRSSTLGDVEIALKGGQMGADNYLVDALRGT